MRSPVVRAAALLRWYPRRWRARYGDEFAELLISDITEHPRSAARTRDIVRGGILARLSGAGLCGCQSGPDASLVSLVLSLAAFGSFGVAIWSQLVIGWQWTPPAAAADRTAIALMSGAVLALMALGIAAAVPVAIAVITRWRTSRARWPAACFLAGLTILVTGGRHFGNGWPGTGGPHAGHHALVPGGLAAFAWACTLSVSSYWAHPSALAHFPAPELAWMACSPLAIAIMTGGAATCVRRAGLSARVLRVQAWLGVAACGAMTVFLTACCLWVFTGGAGQPAAFRAGALDIGGLAIMALALATGQQAAFHARRRTS